MFYWRNNQPACAVVLATLWICLASCDQGKKEFSFYPVDSVVTSQIINLTAKRATLHKEAVLHGQADTIIYTPADTSAWVNELDIFRKLADINKAVNRDRYRVDDGLFDPGSNLAVKAFTSTENLPVMYIKIFYSNSIKNPKKIEALYREENPLYESLRLMSMEFHQIQNKGVLTSYSIDGGQKMIFGDSITFSIKGKIQID